MALASIEDVSIYYEIHGPQHAPPLFLTYCLGGNCHWWRPQAEALARRYRVVLWDPRGHGGSDSPPDPAAYSSTQSAHDLAGLLEHLQIDRAHVGGLSMGGGISARFAQLYPQRPLSLSILDSNTASAQPLTPRTIEVRTRTAKLCDTGDMDVAARYFLANSPPYQLFAADNEANRARLHQMIAGNDPVGFANTLRAMRVPAADPADLALITVPTLLVAGEHDPALAVIQRTQAAIPGSTLEMIEGAGHFSNVDAPNRVLGLLERFLGSVPAPRL